MSEQRVGLGIDVHRLDPSRKLILGGVEIPHDRGLMGHSDADVLTHAICDALLGAAALGDIGTHFPDTDERYRGVSSLTLLAEVLKRIGEAGFSVVNVDATVVAQEPKLTPYFPEIKAKLCTVLGISHDALGLKATTTERLGAIGRAEGIEAVAVCLIGRA